LKLSEFFTGGTFLMESTSKSSKAIDRKMQQILGKLLDETTDFGYVNVIEDTAGCSYIILDGELRVPLEVARWFNREK
jgi:hypothetical protein